MLLCEQKGLSDELSFWKGSPTFVSDMNMEGPLVLVSISLNDVCHF